MAHSQPLETRFWSKVERRAPSECWPWTGVSTPAHRGIFSADGRQWFAHRAAYALAKGPIPEGMCVCHACDNPICVNPSHLWLGSQADNVRDMNEKGRNWQQKKTHCKHGHELTQKNTYRRPGKVSRHCRKCMTRRTSAYRRRARMAAQGSAS